MKKLIYIYLFAFTSVFSEDIQIYQLPLSEDSIEVSVSYRFSSFELDYVEQDTLATSKIKFNLNFENENDLNWIYISQKQIEEEIQIIGTKKIVLANTKQKIVLNYEFGNKSETKKFKVKSFKKLGLVLSDIIPCYVLERKSFSKSTYSKEFEYLNHYLIPNSSHELAGGEDFLKFYYQIFNPDKSSQEYSIIYEVLDAVERVNHRELYSNYSDTNNIIALSNLINLEEFPTGTYYLRVSLIDQEKGSLLSKKDLKFFIVSKRQAQLVSNFTEDELYERSLFATMTIEMVNREFKQTKIIMNSDQVDQFEQLTELKAQRRALYKFWSYRDPDPTTTFNENRDKFERAIRYSDIYYTEPIREGWDSDRGRILIKYGFPQQVDRYEQKAEKNATEVWFYGSQFGGLFFYFVEMSNTNDFRLVHSTHPGEMQNDYWVEEFNPAIDDSGVIERNYNYMRENGRR